MTDHSLILRFDEDPPPMPRSEERKLFAEGLRQNPGRRALLGAMTNPAVGRQYAYAVRNAIQNMYMFAPAGSFEADAKTMFGATRIYVRYVGVEAP